MVTKIIITQYVSTIWEEYDGYAKQYIRETYFNQLPITSVRLFLIIDHFVGLTGYVKDVVDSLNTVDKKYLKKSMFCIFHPKKNTKKST